MIHPVYLVIQCHKHLLSINTFVKRRFNFTMYTPTRIIDFAFVKMLQMKLCYIYIFFFFCISVLYFSVVEILL